MEMHNTTVKKEGFETVVEVGSVRSVSIKPILRRPRPNGCDNEVRSETAHIDDEQDPDRDRRKWR